MKLKYYLRGIGIGMFVTALILSISFSNKKTMSDAEVKARAAELGMVESTTLSQSVEKTTQEESVVEETAKDTPAPTPVPTEEVKEETPVEELATEEATEEEKTETETETAETAEPAEDPQTIGKETTDTNPGSSTKVSIRINSGDSSVTVSNTVAEAGLVASASDFDQFLCSNGYDKRLHVGEYEISYDLTYAEIAKILVGDQ